jgi:uncharacterized protein (DUF1778 family)
MKIMMALRIDPELKEFFQKFARKENRSLSNFITTAAITHIKDRHGIDWHEEDPKEKESE